MKRFRNQAEREQDLIRRVKRIAWRIQGYWHLPGFSIDVSDDIDRDPESNGYGYPTVTLEWPGGCETVDVDNLADELMSRAFRVARESAMFAKRLYDDLIVENCEEITNLCPALDLEPETESVETGAA